MSSYSKAVTIPNRELKEKYFYPVQKVQGYKVYVATDELIPTHKTPARLIMDRDTCVVYLVDPNGMLYMQPQEMFPKEILNAPLFKTIPLPNVQFQQMLTPPPSPPRSVSSTSSSASSSTTAAAAVKGKGRFAAVSSLDTVTGAESSSWAQRRQARDSAEVYYPAMATMTTSSSTSPSVPLSAPAVFYNGQHPSTYYPSSPSSHYLQYPNGVVYVSSGTPEQQQRPSSSRSSPGHSYSHSFPQATTTTTSKRAVKHVRFASQ